MKLRLALASALAALLLVPGTTLAASPYTYRVLVDTCIQHSMDFGVELSIAGSSNANKMILTSYVQQLVSGKWVVGRINGRQPATWTPNGQIHRFQIQTGNLNEGYENGTGLRIKIKMQVFRNKQLLWQKSAIGTNCPGIY